MSGPEQSFELNRKPSGILKINKPKNSFSGTSMEPRTSAVLGDEFSSPSSVSPQLSVTWAFQVDGIRNNFEKHAFPDLSNVGSCENSKHIDMNNRYIYDSSSIQSNKIVQAESEYEDYSASLNAIIKKKASLKRKRSARGNRQSSNTASQIMGSNSADGRRSSIYTTSSAETALTLDDNKEDPTQDKIFENIRLHKEVLQSVKLEPWSMKRKLKLVKQAKSYIARHEGVLQEHFTSRTAKSLLTQFNIFLATKWRQVLRELTNLSTYLIPWESRIKEIESHFGSVVASYFIFLRWLFWVNIVISCLLVIFVMMPEEIYVDSEKAKCDIRKTMSRQEHDITSNFSTIWEFEGRLKYSSLFYGYYSTFSGAIAWGYNLPLAYFLTGLIVYIYSFVATLKKMARNSRMSKLSSKDDEYVFSWKLFTGWDYMIGHTETSHNRTASIILGFKEALLEEAEKRKDTRNWRIILLRISVNLLILVLLAVSAFAVVRVVKRSMDIKDTDSWWTRNEITIVMSLITFFFPMVFEALGLLEYYHPRKQLRIQLARIMVLNLLNLYSLIFALFDKIDHMTEELRKMRPSNFTSGNQCFLLNEIYTFEDHTVASSVLIDNTLTLPLYGDSLFNITDDCYKIIINCNTQNTLSTAVFTALLLSNLSTTFEPENASSFTRNLVSDLMTTSYPVLEHNGIFYETSTELSKQKNANDEYDFTYDDDDAAYYLEQRMKNLPNDQFDGIHINKRDVNITFVYEQLNTTNDTNIQSTIFELATQSLQNTEYNEKDHEFQTLSNTTINDELLETDDDIKERNKEDQSVCYQWICRNDSSSTTKSKSSSEEETTSTTMILKGNVVKNSSDVTQSIIANKSNKVVPESKFKNADIRTLCWETMFGQELAKLTVMDLLVTIFSTMILDFMRALFVRYMNNYWCWDLEKIYPKYGDFKIAENILHLINNQGMVWMGMFFSPGLAVVNIIKLIIIMYLRSWTVLTCNVPHEIVFRASRSNNFYYALLLIMLFLCVLPVSYAIVFLEPSWHCGPFSQSNRIYHLLTNTTDRIIPDAITKYIVSPAAIIPLLVLLILIIYYLISLTGSLREANQDLKIQLRKERTEERRKMFKIASNQHCQPNEGVNGLSSSWHKVLDSTHMRNNSTTNATSENNEYYRQRELLQRMMKKALQKQQRYHNKQNIDRTNNMQFQANIDEAFKTDYENMIEAANDAMEVVPISSFSKINENAKGKLVHGFNDNLSYENMNRHDTSYWVENIPVITISKSSSDECVIDSDIEDSNDNITVIN